MSTLVLILTSLSLTGLLAIAIYRFARSKNRRLFLIQLLIFGTCFGFLYFFFYAPEVPTPKGKGNNDVYFIIILYFFMILGMLAQYGYARFEQPKRRRQQFDFGLFISPVFASPIIFIPLLAAMQSVEVDLQNLTTAKIMVFLVAFENGFFWKEYFDNRRKPKR